MLRGRSATLWSPGGGRYTEEWRSLNIPCLKSSQNQAKYLNRIGPATLDECRADSFSNHQLTTTDGQS